MADNALQSVQKLLQDLIAPDVRETKVRLEQLEKNLDARLESMRKETSSHFASVDNQFESMRRENEANYRSILSAIGEMKANADSVSMREVAALRERVAVLEATRPPH